MINIIKVRYTPADTMQTATPGINDDSLDWRAQLVGLGSPTVAEEAGDPVAVQSKKLDVFAVSVW